MRLSFAFRLIASVVTIEVVMLLFLVWNNSRIIGNSHAELLQSISREQSALLASAVAPGLIAYDHAMIDDVLQQLREKHALIYADVFDVNDRLVSAIGERPDVDYVATEGRYYEKFDNDQYHISRKIEVAGQQAGRLRLAYSTQAFQDIVEQVRLHNLLVSVIALFALVVATVVISFLLTKKLHRLKQGVEEIQQGRLDCNIDIHSNDELGDVAMAFNQMARHLQRVQQQLTQEHHELQRQSSHLNTLLDSIDAVIWELDPYKHQFTFVSHEASDLLGYSLDSWMQPDFLDRALYSKDKKQLMNMFMDLSAGGQSSIDARFRRSDEQIIWTRVIASSSYDETTGSQVIRGLIVDIRDEKKREQQIVYLAEHDALTGLINRRQFQERLTHHIAYGKRYGHKSCLLFVDIDQFKYVNDTFGHVAGDAYLVQVAEVLSHAVRDTDILGRLGGDEFGIILPFTDEEEASLVAANLLVAFAEKDWLYEGFTVHIRASIGITCFPVGEKTPSELLAEADTAMYAAKALGRNRYHIYREQDSGKERMQAKLQIESLIRSAFEDERFVLEYQPIIDLASSSVKHYEALIRIRQHHGEHILPGEFIDTAERFGLIGEIDRWTFSRVIQGIHESINAGRVRDIAVNLSGVHLDDVGFHNWIKTMLINFDQVASHLIIEVTETAAIKNLVSAREFMLSMRDMGVRFAIDDFGAGFSSFHYIKNLPVHYVKIDGSFVRHVHKDTADRVFVQAAVDIARSLDIATIAEFVENEQIVKILQDIGANYGQGYHLGRPAEDFVD